MFKTTLLLALRSAERVDVHGYEMENLDYGEDALGDVVRLGVAGGDYLFFFDGSQEIEIHDGYCEVVPVENPEEPGDFGGMVEEEPEIEKSVSLEFKMMKAMTEEDLLL